MSERSESLHRQSPGGTDEEARLANRLATGSDDSAGIGTRILAGVPLALVIPWVITRRVVTGGIAGVAWVLRSCGAATSKAVGQGARRLAAMLAFVGSEFSSAARPLVDAGGRYLHIVSRGARLIAELASGSGRRVRAVIGSAAGPAAELVFLDGSPAEFTFEEDGPRYAGTDTAALAWRYGPPDNPVVRGLDILTIRDGLISVVRTLIVPD